LRRCRICRGLIAFAIVVNDEALFQAKGSNNMTTTYAKNEAIKLRANFWNNLSVGILLTGVLIPVLSFFEDSPEIGQWVKDTWTGNVAVSEVGRRFVLAIGAFLVAAIVASGFRREAQRIIGELD
jgi:hypothetical protein